MDAGTAAVTGDQQPDQPATRRRLVLVPARDYPDADARFRQGIDEQVAVATAWWADKDGLDKRVFDPVRPADLRSRRDLDAFIHDARLRDAGADDVLVVYITGHGHRGPSGRHYLLLPDGHRPGGGPPRPDRDGYPTADLVAAALQSDARHVLVIVNSCFANAVADDLRRQLRDLPRDRRQLETLAVIASADFDEGPQVWEFGELLTRVHRQLRETAGIADPHLTIEQFLQELTRATRADPDQPLLRPRKLWPEEYSLTPTLCLPNPGYVPPDDVVAPARRQVAAGAAELDYWLDRASGRQDATDPGWYFTGRHALTTAVASFLAGDDGVLLVTGMAGTGKSAIIARAVTLSDPDLHADPRYSAAVLAAPPQTVPRSRSVDVAVLARNQSVTDLLTTILTSLGQQPTAEAPDTDRASVLRGQLRSALAGAAHAAGRPIVIVLDGLDEAQEPVRVVTDLIGPLSRTNNTHNTNSTDSTGNTASSDSSGRPVLRWLIGIRSPRSSAPADDTTGLMDLLLRATQTRQPQVIRTDGPEIPGDIAAYVAGILERGTRWYATHPADREAVAKVVADRVQPSFLDARLAAGRLLRAEGPQPLDDPTWLASFDEGSVGQLRLDLADAAAPGVPTDRVIAVLRGPAFALGAGLPWADVWPAVAQAVLGRPLPDADALIRHVLTGRLSGYLQRAVEDGRTVYAPAHDRLAHVLRDQVHRLTEEPP